MLQRRGNLRKERFKQQKNINLYTSLALHVFRVTALCAAAGNFDTVFVCCRDSFFRTENVAEGKYEKRFS